jgi:hypothetical protein
MSTNTNNRGNPHEVNAYNIGRVAYSVEALDIIARHVGELYEVKPAAVFVKMMTALEEGHHPYAAGIRFALERRGKGKGEPVKPPAPVARTPILDAPDDFDIPTEPYKHDY